VRNKNSARSIVAECAIPHSALRIPHSAFTFPHQTWTVPPPWAQSRRTPHPPLEPLCALLFSKCEVRSAKCERAKAVIRTSPLAPRPSAIFLHQTRIVPPPWAQSRRTLHPPLEPLCALLFSPPECWSVGVLECGQAIDSGIMTPLFHHSISLSKWRDLSASPSCLEDQVLNAKFPCAPAPK